MLAGTKAQMAGLNAAKNTDSFIEWKKLLYRYFTQVTFHHQITINTIAVSHKTILLSQEIEKGNEMCLVQHMALYYTLIYYTGERKRPPSQAGDRKSMS